MITILSPAKRLDYATPAKITTHSMPVFLEDATYLVGLLQNMQAGEIANLMTLSVKLGELNYQRYQAWSNPPSPENVKQALFAFKGEVYASMNADSFDHQDIHYAQNHLRLLSGLYGLLRPLDLIQPYRLEMGTRLENKSGNTLYSFWGSRIAERINQDLQQQEDPTLINLASVEYFKVIDANQIQGRLLTIQFKEWRNGQYKTIGIYAKKARGIMSAYIIKKRINQADDLLAFDQDGYQFDQAQSSDDVWVFARKS